MVPVLFLMDYKVFLISSKYALTTWIGSGSGINNTRSTTLVCAQRRLPTCPTGSLLRAGLAHLGDDERVVVGVRVKPGQLHKARVDHVRDALYQERKRINMIFYYKKISNLEYRCGPLWR